MFFVFGRCFVKLLSTSIAKVFPSGPGSNHFVLGIKLFQRSLRSSQAMPSRTLSGLKMEQRQTQCSFQRVPRPLSDR